MKSTAKQCLGKAILVYAPQRARAAHEVKQEVSKRQNNQSAREKNNVSASTTTSPRLSTRGSGTVGVAVHPKGRSRYHNFHEILLSHSQNTGTR